jgi:hypothetical protein
VPQDMYTLSRCLIVLWLISQWNTVDEREQPSLVEERIPLVGTQVTLTPMQIRTFIVTV